jgi:signal transduction histidine kinase
MISLSQIREIFPFCLVLSQDEKILQVGRSLDEFSSLLVGCQLSSVATLQRTMKRLDEGVVHHLGRTVSLQLDGVGYFLSGAFYRTETGFIFCGAPRPLSSAELERSGLTISSFSAHDSLLSYLMNLQELERAKVEAERLSADSAARRNDIERILDCAHDLILAFDREGAIVLTNPRAREVLELDNGTVNLRDLQELPVPGTAPGWMNALEDASAQETAFSLLTSSGRTVRLEGRISAAFGESKGHLVAFLRDVTEEHRVASELALANQRLARSERMEAVGRLAGAISHDFSNILGVILGSADLLMDDLCESDPSFEGLELIRSSAQKGAEVARQLLSVGDGVPETSGSANLTTVLHDLDPILRLMAPRGSVVCSAELDTAWVSLGQGLIEQILMNLVVNAGEAIEEGGFVEVTVKVGPSPDKVHLCVRDDGVGIEPGLLDKVFDPYFTTKKDAGGSGIGLSTVFALARRAGGSVEVESQLGEWTEFRVELLLCAERPVALPAKAEVREVEVREGSVVVVDDNAGINQIVSRQLRNMGLEVVSYPGYVSAMEGLEELAVVPDLLVTDVSLGDGSGLDLAQNAMEKGLCSKVLIITGHADIDRVSNMIETYKWPLLMKPFGGKELRRSVNACLGRSDS